MISIPAPVVDNGIRKNSYALELITYGQKKHDLGEDDIVACINNNEEALYVSIVGNKAVSDDIISHALLILRLESYVLMAQEIAFIQIRRLSGCSALPMN